MSGPGGDMYEGLTFRERWHWIVLVWRRYEKVANPYVAELPVPYLRRYGWWCLRVTVGLLFNNEVMPTDIEDQVPELRLAFSADAGDAHSWDFVQLTGWVGFYIGSDGDL